MYYYIYKMQPKPHLFNISKSFREFGLIKLYSVQFSFFFFFKTYKIQQHIKHSTINYPSGFQFSSWAFYAFSLQLNINVAYLKFLLIYIKLILWYMDPSARTYFIDLQNLSIAISSSYWLKNYMLYVFAQKSFAMSFIVSSKLPFYMSLCI